MTFRSRIFIAFAATSVVPLVILAAGIAHELDRRLTEADRHGASELATQTKRDIAAAESGIAERLAAVRDGLADDNRFRAAVLGAPSERTYLLDYAARAMRLSGLAMLQIENDSGRILSSGQYRNEYDRDDSDLLPALQSAPGGAALVWARTPAGPVLVLARADSVRLAGRRFVLIGGSDMSPERFSHGTSDGALSVSLIVAPAAGGMPVAIGPGGVSGGDAVTVASLPIPAITPSSSGRRFVSSARFDIRQSASAFRVLRTAILWWCLVAAAAAAAAALGTASWLAERISCPIRMLAQQAAVISLSSPVTGLASDRTDEIGALARVLEAMVVRLRAAAARLRDAERRAVVGDIARQVTHDVKNGLIPIRHVMRHLADVHRAQPDQLATVFAERRPTLDASVDYLDQLARNYARLSPRIAAGPCDINAVAEVVASGYTTLGAIPSVVLQLDARIPRLAADTLAMRRILENLVSNACDATAHRAGAVTITTHWTGQEVWITVADTGNGMSAPQLQSAFSDFFTTKPDGTGLGLSIVRRLVHDVRGTLRVESAPGRGTIVTLVFPGGAAGSAAPREMRAS